MSSSRRPKCGLLLARSGEISLETAPLVPWSPGEARCVVMPLPVVPGDWRLRHKTTDRSFYETALAVAKARGASETVLVRDEGQVTEGTYSNLFVERGGKLLTPPAALGLLPGVLRRQLLEEGRAEEAELTLADLADGFLLGNAVRGLTAARIGT